MTKRGKQASRKAAARKIVIFRDALFVNPEDCQGAGLDGLHGLLILNRHWEMAWLSARHARYVSHIRQ